MKKLFFLGVLLSLSVNGWSQDLSEFQKDSIAQVQHQQDKDSAVKLIEDFFVAFHKRDTAALRNYAHPELTMRSISIDSSASSKITSEKYSEFLKSIAAIPNSTGFEERLNTIAVYVNGEFGNVLTPYSFFRNGKSTHCGVNSFQLLKVGEEWKIIGIMDTRKKQGCQVKSEE